MLRMPQEEMFLDLIEEAMNLPMNLEPESQSIQQSEDVGIEVGNLIPIL